MKTSAFLLLASCWLAGCDDNGRGNVAFTTWGEDFIEQEIPTSAFADGWSVRYSHFRVVLGGIRIANESGVVAAEMKETKLFDHHAVGIKKVTTFEGLDAEPWPSVRFEIRPAAAETTLGEGASAADLDFMKQSGFAVWAEGEATRGAEKKTFAWGFPVATAFVDCRGQKDGKETLGVLVTNGGTDDAEITIHGDHLFYDDLQSPNAVIRFDAIASADTNNDGEITLAELSAKKLVEIDPASGGYGTGSASDVNDLGAFVTALSRTVGHFRGEGECFSTNP